MAEDDRASTGGEQNEPADAVRARLGAIRNLLREVEPLMTTLEGMAAQIQGAMRLKPVLAEVVQRILDQPDAELRDRLEKLQHALQNEEPQTLTRPDMLRNRCQV